jgi:hypothetical protein
MAINVNAGRQEVIAAVQEIDGATVGAAGAQGGIQLPEGAIVLSGQLMVSEAFTGGVDITIAVAGGGLTITASDADAAGASFDGTVDGSVVGAGGASAVITTAGTTPTGGKAYVVIQYVVAGRAAFSEG